MRMVEDLVGVRAFLPLWVDAGTLEFNSAGRSGKEIRWAVRDREFRNHARGVLRTKEIGTG